jgi:NADH-quinone oxidoreductase subunit A
MNFLFVLAFVFVSAAFVFGAIVASRLVAPSHPNQVKNQTFECGNETIGTSRIQFNVGYYLFALLFLVFDVEAAFLFPWAVVFREAGLSGLIEVGLFMLALLVGLAYAWRKGALEWV